MKGNHRFYLWLICGLFLFTSVSWAAKPTLGEIPPGVYPMEAINNHLPFVYKTAKEYLSSLQKVELTTGNLGQFKDVPKLGLKKPYTGTIVLGDKPQRFGVIVDIVGEEKRLYVDTNGDGSFAGKPYTPLLDQWWGLDEDYSVTAPEPITLMVGYQSKPALSYPLEISVMGVLIQPGSLKKIKPYLLVQVRTWFLAKVTEDGAEKYMAVVDRNNNGCFNDPQDLLLIDYYNQGFFGLEGAVAHKKGVTLKCGQKQLTADWDVYPDQLAIAEKN